MGRSKSRRTWLIALVLVALLVATDRNVSARAAIYAIDEYRAHVSPHLRGRVFCRFTPTCSEYAMDAIHEHGSARGTWMALKRISRCHPWHAGGFDPVP